jgi:hypothetical protein
MEYMSIRQIMVFRADLRRNTAAPDLDGHPGPPFWKSIDDDLACYIWSTSGKMIVGNKVVDDDILVGVFPRETDITIDDRIWSIKDRQGNEIFKKLNITTVTIRADHVRVGLKRLE